MLFAFVGFGGGAPPDMFVGIMVLSPLRPHLPEKGGVTGVCVSRAVACRFASVHGGALGLHNCFVARSNVPVGEG